MPDTRNEPASIIPAPRTMLFCLWLCICLFLQACVTAHAPGDSFFAVFTWEGRADTICLVGDFNSWQSDANCMKNVDGKAVFRLDLDPGHYAYAFLVDGVHTPDPDAAASIDDGFGSVNSLLVVE